VGEVCARAVRRSQQAGVRHAVTIELEDRGPQLDVVVTDAAAERDSEDEYVAMSLVRGLADDVRVEAGPGGPGGLVRLSWTR
jgi:hypothetical protein